MKSNPFELGFGATDHEIAIENLPIQGAVPDWLSGTLLRNGPGSFQVGKESYKHWFDGLAMLHKFTMGGGKISYSNKYLNTQAYRAAKETGQISYSEFATDPCRSLFGRVMSVFDPKITDSAKVSIAKIADRFLALAETPIQIEFDLETLETVGVFSCEKNLTGQMTTVHPQFDFTTGDVYNVVTRYHRISHYNIYTLKNLPDVRKIASLPVHKPSYMHSFGMSQNYIILTEFPLVVNPLSLLLWLKPYIENFKWKPDRGTPFWVLNRFTGEVVGRYESDPFFAFHHVNAFEDGDHLYVDLVAYPDSGIINHYYLNRLKDPFLELPYGNVRRYSIPLKGKTASYEVLSDSCFELPNFDYARFNTNPDYRYLYAISLHPENRQGFYNQIIKLDIKTQQTYTWYRENCYPGEPIFVGKPGRSEEDDGVLLSVVLDSYHGHSFLLILDAHSLETIAEAKIPQPVLFGYHGAYLT
jgi:beta,beta-carotene 9',10'-dioxygenase